MINEHMEEQAALHVLGALTVQESVDFKKAMEVSPELRELVAQLMTASGTIAGAVPAVTPPAHLRAKILAEVANSQKIVALPSANSGMNSIPWALAACFAILCSVLFLRESRLQRTVAESRQQFGALEQLANSLEAATNNLQRTVLALQENNRLANLRIAMLNSVSAHEPKTLGVTLWDAHRQDGVFVAQNLRALPLNKDYELWVIDETQKPVAAGVFHVETDGSVRMEFKPSRLIKTAGVFAVTEEIKGGVDSPTLKNMVLASK